MDGKSPLEIIDLLLVTASAAAVPGADDARDGSSSDGSRSLRYFQARGHLYRQHQINRYGSSVSETDLYTQ